MPTAARRQVRGERRIAEILDAAAVVFGRVGVERATTNAVAAQAGISPGSLYQYFSDKDDIAASLGRRYARDLEQAHAAAFARFEAGSASTTEAMDRILDPIMAFKRDNAGFVTVFARPDLPDSLTGPVGREEAVFAARLAELLELRNPTADPADVGTAVQTVITLVRGSLGAPDDALPEVKLAILGYLDRKGLR